MPENLVFCDRPVNWWVFPEAQRNNFLSQRWQSSRFESRWQSGTKAMCLKGLTMLSQMCCEWLIGRLLCVQVTQHVCYLLHTRLSSPADLQRDGVLLLFTCGACHTTDHSTESHGKKEVPCSTLTQGPSQSRMEDTEDSTDALAPRVTSLFPSWMFLRCWKNWEAVSVSLQERLVSLVNVRRTRWEAKVNWGCVQMAVTSTFWGRGTCQRVTNAKRNDQSSLARRKNCQCGYLSNVMINFQYLQVP